MKLPKQFRHWCMLHGLKPYVSYQYCRQSKHKYLYLTAGEYYYRVNDMGKFQQSRPIADFNGWADSTQHTFDLPRTKEDFNHVMKNFSRRNKRMARAKEFLKKKIKEKFHGNERSE